MRRIEKITILGGGHMGGSIALGLAASGLVSATDLTVTARTRKTLDQLAAACSGLHTSLDNARAVQGAGLVLLAVKPWQLEEVVSGIREHLSPSAAVASVVAGVTFQEMENMLGGSGQRPLLRIIPNTAISLRRSMTFIAGQAVDAPLREEILRLFGQLGQVIWTTEERMPAGTALASCGIAYALQYIQAATKGGVALGFEEKESLQTVIATMEGALALLKEGSLPQTEIDKVTTPGGLTFKGLQAMEEGGFSAAVEAGLKNSR